MEVIAQQTGGGPLSYRPELYSDLIDYYHAFIRLSFSRMRGVNGPNPIQVTDILAYAAAFGFSDREYFLRVIQAADAGLLAAWADRGEDG